MSSPDPAAEQPRKRATAGPERSVIVRLALKYGVDETKLFDTLKATAFRQPKARGNQPQVEVSNEQMMALMVVSDQYDLNPFTREIYAFPDKNKGIVPIVSVDGWTRIINEHPDFDGVEFRYSDKLVVHPTGEHPPAFEWIEVVIYHKRRSKPWVVREYFDECYRPPFQGSGDSGPYTVNGPWQTHPKRFTRHKAWIQGGRLAFGFAGIHDEDEADRIAKAMEFNNEKPAGEQSRTDAAKDKLRAAAAALEAPKANEHDELLKPTINAEAEREAVSVRQHQQGAEADGQRRKAERDQAAQADAQHREATAKELERHLDTRLGQREQAKPAAPAVDLFDEPTAPLTDSDFIQGFRGADTKARMDQLWDVALEHYTKINREVPFEVEDAYTTAKDRLR